MALIDKLTAIADGFRASRGTTQEYTLDEMAVLAAEEVGGSAPVVEPLSVTENGTYTAPSGVDGYNPVTVNVASGIKYGVEFLENDGYGAPKNVKIYGCPNSLESIIYVPEYMFYRYSASSGAWGYGLQTVTLDEKISIISESAFYKCTNLKQINFPAKIERINSKAFYGCSGLDEITFDGKPTYIDSTAFTNCNYITTINVPWAEGEVASAPWGATNATINYNYTGG